MTHPTDEMVERAKRLAREINGQSAKLHLPDDQTWQTFGSDGPKITYGDLRRARQALSEDE